MNTPQHVAIVVNPSKTSRDDIEKELDSVEFDGPGPRISWLETTVEDPGHGMAQEALDMGADLVIAAGGDGTVRAVAECLADADTSAHLGVVPLGTGNLLARNLDIPLGNIGKALEAALTGDVLTIDLAWAEADLDGTPQRNAFTVMAGVGVDAHMITETDEDLKDKVGWLAYVESLGRAVSASDVISMALTVDGEKTGNEEAHTLIVGNCGILTGGVTLLPDADPVDGELDLLVLSADGVAGWLDTMRSMMWDNGLKRLVGATDKAESSDSVMHRRVTAVTVELGESRVLELDGDDVGECSRVEFSIQPAAIRVRTPRS
ncbi:diacylglycerol/lipid kinase family protein [Demequina muriae]|uniref:Diacylglycerol kinase family protein n=1 Tax=Demequina muriae TaxID=3051664 RepID=A0ABT8GIC9_9MICO|nr:diacylglycerol kinase family protein [Demequina sp. EGI L300058]MDN4481170.1 diacylglycerol kinase family protein [Demequina sp. EGI L300058]